ncbi:MAG: hypothetical protein OHM56_11025 [Spiroplasma phoeniceum]|nr:MAG: hypothetical protein OHM57_10450 [Spiroplasma phoeniceum]UZQ32089.1 MAG: hypothetical protein OHM56_11025 [Spiroplasma phoeniceum]
MNPKEHPQGCYACNCSCLGTDGEFCTKCSNCSSKDNHTQKKTGKHWS